MPWPPTVHRCRCSASRPRLAASVATDMPLNPLPTPVCDLPTLCPTHPREAPWRPNTHAHAPIQCSQRTHEANPLFYPLHAPQTSMSGIAVTEDAVNLFYLMRLKATVRSQPCSFLYFHGPPWMACSVRTFFCLMRRNTTVCVGCVPPSARGRACRTRRAVAVASCLLFCRLHLPPTTLPPPLPAVQVGAVAGGRQRPVGGHCCSG